MEDENPLIKKYQNEVRWVNYKMLLVDGRITKIPFSPITRRKGSTSDPATWGTYAQAKEVDAEHIGIIFTEDKKLLGIDVDDCLVNGKIVGEHKELIEQLILRADTYCEISPSGKGLHLYIELDEPFTPLKNRHGDFEVYTSGRYFTVTGNPYTKKT